MIESQNSDGHAPLHSFSIVQHNCTGSNLVFLTVFHSLEIGMFLLCVYKTLLCFKAAHLGHLVFNVMFQIFLVSRKE